jgi:hypothetical protein
VIRGERTIPQGNEGIVSTEDADRGAAVSASPILSGDLGKTATAIASRIIVPIKVAVITAQTAHDVVAVLFLSRSDFA